MCTITGAVGLSVRPDAPQQLQGRPAPEEIVRGARVVGVLALWGSLLLAGCVSNAPGPAGNETNASEQSAAAWAPGPSWDPFYDAQSADGNTWDPWPDSVDGPQDDPAGEVGSSGTDTTDGGGSGSTDRTTTDGGTIGSDTSSSHSEDEGGTDDTASDDEADDSGPDDSDDTGSLVDETNDTVTSTTENTTEALNTTSENDSPLDTNLSD